MTLKVTSGQRPNSELSAKVEKGAVCLLARLSTWAVLQWQVSINNALR